MKVRRVILLSAVLSAMPLSAAFHSADSLVVDMFRNDPAMPALPDIQDGYGAAFRDLDGDSRPDLYLVCFRNLNRVLLNPGTSERFTDATIRSGLGGDLMSRARHNLELGTAAFDFDNDGDGDVLIAGWDGTARIFRNDGNLRFADLGGLLPPVSDAWDVNDAAVCDVNRDGRLDLFLTDEHHGNHLLISAGNGRYEDRTRWAGLQSEGISQCAAFSDIDRDGDMDLFVTRWFLPSLFYRNLGDGRFRKIEMSLAVSTLPQVANGAGFGDIDNDGDFDLFVANRNGWNFLYLNGTAAGDSNWVFRDGAEAWGLSEPGCFYGGVFADFNQDGRLDLYVTAIGSDRVYLNRKNRFEKVYSETFAPGQVKSYSTGAAAADFDRDGDLDLFVANKDTFARFFVNPAEWPSVRLRMHGVQSNRDAVGCRVDFYRPPQFGEKPVLLGSREISGRGGYLSSSDTEVHFGLGPESTVDARVHFPSGRVAVLTGLAGGRVYEVEECPLLQRAALRAWRRAIRLFHSRDFWTQAALMAAFLCQAGLLLRLGLKRYGWKPGATAGMLGFFFLTALFAVSILQPLGRNRAFTAMNLLGALSILVAAFYSERTARYRRMRRRYHSILLNLGRQIVHIHDDHELMKTVVDHIAKDTEFTTSSAWIADETGRAFRLAASGGMEQAKDLIACKDWWPQMKKTLLNAAWIRDSRPQGLEKLFLAAGARILIPIKREDRLFGLLALCASGPVKSLSSEDAAIFTSVADQAAVALENNRFVRQSNDMVKQLTEARLREEYLKKLETANASLDSKNRELSRLYDELKQAEILLVHSEKMASLGQLVAGLSHELNNPVGFIYANMKQLRAYIARIEGVLRDRDMQSAGSLLEDIESLIRETEKGSEVLKKLVENLKDFSHLDRAEWEEADIHEGIESCLVILQYELRDRIEVVRRFEADGRIQCRPGHLNQVFMNLLSNAAQAIQGKGRIDIETQDRGEDILIAIRDNGRGIPEENQGKIFDPFFTTKPVGQGMGLGLAISYSIVKSHGGRITFESGEGGGSVFRLVLPRKRTG
ncbi:VCBS repeat-containing protein [bacterium]|nr:VCBS repeat-containing protein [bacterium]